MKVIVCKDYDEMSKKAAEFYASRIKDVKVLGLATGSTPLGLYKELAEKNKKGEISFKDITTVNLDEYIGLPEGHEQSYKQFMKDNFFDHIDIDINRTHIPSAKDQNDIEACKEYDELIESVGGIDIQLLGVGENGHIAFNEPDKSLPFGTNIVRLTDSTIEVNSRFFNSVDEVPRYAIGMGVGKIMGAKTIVMMANGKRKADAIRALIKSDQITTMCPITLLKLHHDVHIFIDQELYEALW